MDIIHAFPPAFIEHLDLKCECAKRYFIEWVVLNVLHKNIPAWELVLDNSMKLVNQNFGAFTWNLVWYFYLSELKFVILYHALQLIFKVRLGVKDVRLPLKLDDFIFFINENLIGVHSVFQVAVSTQVCVYL